MNHALQNTLGNDQWLRENESAIKKLFPAEWSHASRIDQLKLRWNLKLLGVDYRSEDEFIKILTFFAKIGFVQHDQDFLEMIRANPDSVFEKVNK